MFGIYTNWDVLDDCETCGAPVGEPCYNQEPPPGRLVVPHADRKEVPAWECKFRVYARTREEAEKILGETDWGLWSNAGPSSDLKPVQEES